MNAWVPIIGTIATIVVGLGSSYLAYRQAIKVAATNQRGETERADAAAYQRAKEIYESAIKQLDEQIERLRKTVNEQEIDNGKLRAEMEELRATVSRLRQELIRAGIDIELEKARLTTIRGANPSRA